MIARAHILAALAAVDGEPLSRAAIMDRVAGSRTLEPMHWRRLDVLITRLLYSGHVIESAEPRMPCPGDGDGDVEIRYALTAAGESVAVMQLWAQQFMGAVKARVV